MYTKKQHIVRKTIIVSVSFLLGFASAIFAAATYDANIQTRATKMFNTIKSNASTLATADQQAYYTLVRLNIQSLIQVLTSVDSSLMVELGSTPDIEDDVIVDQITTGSSSTNQGNSNSTTTLSSTTSNNSITVTVNSGILYCGDPSKNDYTTYSPVDKKVIIQKSYCNEKGGKIWIKCNGENTNIKTVDSFQGGEVLSCPSTSVQTPGTATSVSSSVQTSTSVNGCNWQYHSVVGPVGALTVNPSTTTCTPNTNGTKAVEVTGNRQTVATCNCATANSTTPTPGTVASVKQVTLTVPSGMIACGNPDKNDYTTYSTVNGKVIIQKDYCIAKGGYVWVMCGGKATNIKNVDAIQDGVTFSCPTVSNTPTTTNSCNWKYHAVFGPVGTTTVDPGTTSCTVANNGLKAKEVSGIQQTVATCTCSTSVTPGTATPTTLSPNTISCAGTAPVGEGVIKSTSVAGMVGSDTWNYVTNTKGTSTDLGQSCQWTCAPGFSRVENKCVKGGSVSSLIISPTSGVFSMTDKNTITATVTGLTKENTLVCNEVLAHPAYPSAISPAGYCSNPANFVPFSGNEGWTYMDGRWIGNIKYNASIYGAAGIKVRGYWKNKATGAVVTYDLSVIAGTNNTTTGISSNQEYRWSCIVPGPVVVDTSNYSCNSSNIGKSQTIGGYSCNCTGPTPTPGTVASVKQVTLTVPSGMIACGNPDKNDYTTYSTVDGKVIIQKDYCIAKGGYIWVMCGGKATNIKNVDMIKDGETLSCPSTTTSSSVTPASLTFSKSCNFSGNPQNFYFKVNNSCQSALFDCKNGYLQFSSSQFGGTTVPSPGSQIFDTQDLCNGITGSNVRIEVGYGKTTLDCLDPTQGLAVDIWNAASDIDICQETDIPWRGQRDICSTTGGAWVKASTAWPGKYINGAWRQYVRLLDSKSYVPGKYRFAARSSDGKIVYSDWTTIIAQGNKLASQFINPQSCIPNRFKPASTEELVDYLLNHETFWLGFIDYSGLGENANAVQTNLFRMAQIGRLPNINSKTIAYDATSGVNISQYFTRKIPNPPATYIDEFGTTISGESRNNAYFDFQSWYAGGNAWTTLTCRGTSVPRPYTQKYDGKAWKSGDIAPTTCSPNGAYISQ